MQSFLIMRCNNDQDLINSFLPGYKENNYYSVFFNEKIEKKYDFTLASVHEPATIQYKDNANILIGVVSYVPEIDDKNWPAFYTNLCTVDVLVIDSFNLDKLNSITYPKKRVILMDGSHIPCEQKTWPKDVTNRCINLQKRPKLFNLDTTNNKVWEKFVEYFTAKSTKNKDFKYRYVITPFLSEADIGISFEPLGYGLTYYYSNMFRFSQFGFNESTSLILDSRQNTHLGRRIGLVIDVKSSAFVPQIKREFEVFLETLDSLIDHVITKDNPLQTYTTNQYLLDRIFHQLNMTYSNG